MNRTFLYICLVAIAIHMTAIGSFAQEKPTLSKMSWLVGSWKGVAGNEPFYEAWRKASATELKQYGIKITKSDTIVSEIGKIVLTDDMATYGDGQHSWALKSLSGDQMVFANPQISFPNTITWKKLPNGHWYCLLNTNERRIEYDIVQVPALNKVVDHWIKNKKKT